jgi:hypothetical protein
MRWTIAAVLLGFAWTAMAADAGQIKTASGTVHLERAGKKVPAKIGMPVLQSDIVVTGADGAAGITFTDNSLLSVGPNSVLAIDKYAFDSTTHAGQFDASLKKGTLAVISGKIVKQSPEAMRVRTPSSIMGVRGTEFVVKVD